MVSPTSTMVHEQTLDPDSWEELRALGHRMVDDMVAYLATVRERPVWQPTSAEAREALAQPAPREGAGPTAAYEEFVSHILPYPMGNIHPRFWGWVIGTGTLNGAYAEMLAAVMNPNVGGGDQAAALVEAQVVAWCREMLGYPAEASGLLVTGASEANLLGLAVARQACAGIDVRAQGVRAAGGPLTVYASNETHSSVRKAVELLGLGTDGLRLAPVHDDFTVDVGALAEMVRADRAAGSVPVAIVANAGTVNTGAFDDIPALADLAARERVWLHVDGAFGALAAIAPDSVSEENRRRLDAMARADSLGFDLHKWMYMPYDVGCVLVRDAAMHRATFSLTPSYLQRATRGLAAGDYWPSDYGMQLSRGFRALKAWMLLKEHGVETYAAQVRKNVAQATYLAALVDEAPDLERLAPAPLNIVCFRYVGRAAPEQAARDDEALNVLNRELLVRLQESGVAFPTNAIIGGRYAIRVAISNHRSRRDDFELLVDEVRRLGRALEREPGVSA